MRLINLALLMSFIVSLAVVAGFMGISWVRYQRTDHNRRNRLGLDWSGDGLSRLGFRAFEEWDAVLGPNGTFCEGPHALGGFSRPTAAVQEGLEREEESWAPRKPTWHRCVLPTEVFHRGRPFHFGGCGPDASSGGGGGTVAAAAEAVGARKPCGEWGKAHLLDECKEAGAPCTALLLPSRSLGGACSPGGECIAASFLSYYASDGVRVEGVCACDGDSP